MAERGVIIVRITVRNMRVISHILGYERLIQECNGRLYSNTILTNFHSCGFFDVTGFFGTSSARNSSKH